MNMCSTIKVDLEKEGREQMYEKLCEMFSKEEVESTLENKVVQHLTHMFDNREKLREMAQEKE